MPLYRKKPVIVEAHQLPLTGSAPDELIKFLQQIDGGSFVEDGSFLTSGFGMSFAIPTLEGTMLASPGDFIIKGVQGEFYPCKPDIFHETYEDFNNAD